jgi:hypothetical protein
LEISGHGTSILFATGGGGALQRASPSGAGISHESKKKQVPRQKIFGRGPISENSAIEMNLNEAAAGGHNLFQVVGRKANAPSEADQSSGRLSEALAMPSFSISS